MRIPALTFLLVLSAASLAAALPERNFDLGTQRPKAISLTAPVILKIQHVNKLRYEVLIGDDVSAVQGASLTTLLPKLPAGATTSPLGSAANPVSGQGTPAGPQNPVGPVNPVAPMSGDSGSEDPDVTFAKDVVQPATDALTKLRMAYGDLDGLVRGSNAILSATGGDVLLAQRSKTLAEALRTALAAQWPTSAIETVSAQVERRRSTVKADTAKIGAESRAAAAPAEKGKKGPAGGKSADAASRAVRLARDLMLLAAADSTDAHLAAWSTGGGHESAYETLRQSLARWEPILVAMGDPGSYTVSYEVSDPSSRADGQDHTISARFSDRVPSIVDGGTQLSAPQVVDIATVHSDPRWSVATGWLFSQLDAVDFEAKADTADRRIIEYKERGNQQAPVALINLRLTDYSDGLYDFYASFGPTLNITDSGSSLAVNFFGGVGFSIARKCFIVGGWHRGQVRELDNGLQRGDVLTRDSATPTTHLHWVTKPAFAVGIQF